MGLPHPAVALEAGRRRTQVASSGGVRVGKGAAKVFGGSRGWRDRDQAGLLKPRRAVIEHRHDGYAGVRGLGEPREPRNLVGDPPAAAIRFPDGVDRCALLSARKLQCSPGFGASACDDSTISRVVRGIGNYSAVQHRDRSTT